MATGIEESARIASPRSVDEVQELIGRVEAMLATLEDYGEGNSERLRRKLNETVSLARGNLVEDRGVEGTPPRLPELFTMVSFAVLGGLMVGLLVASPERRCG